nr:PHB depolymerase family esterase [uncultured Actinoplanes sp.]
MVRFLVAAVLVAGALLTPGAAPAAATLTEVTSFGSNPGALRMYSYVPAGLPAGRPLIVALHGCTQSAADYYGHAGWPKYADLYQAAVVFPEQTPSNNPLSCFTWFAAGDIGRGQGEALSIKQMVDHAVAHYGSDSRRVYVTGLSAGGAMTAVMLAAYPDVFAAGAVVAGLPYHCGTICQSRPQHRTPAQWGDLVRAANPGYRGPWPRVAIWYGTADTTVVPANATELRDQWTNVSGVSQTPTGTQSLPNTSVSRYGSAVALYQVSGIAHGTPVDPGSGTGQCGTTGRYYIDSLCSSYYTAQFWGLDGGATPPPPVACFTAGTYAQVAAGRC